MNMLNKPHLPQNAVKTVICGKNKEITELIEKNGAEVITISDDVRLPEPIINHADIQCCHIGKGKILTTNSKLIDSVEGYEITLINETPGKLYPADCLLNCFVLGNILISGKHCSKSVLEYAEINSLETRLVNQGYAKCSTAIISEDAVITADKSIAKALENDCRILLVEQGYIKLAGYNYGFIGGACGKIASDKIIFAGNPFKHPDGKKIISFSEQNNCEVISLCNGELIDFGGFIPIF